MFQILVASIVSALAGWTLNASGQTETVEGSKPPYDLIIAADSEAIDRNPKDFANYYGRGGHYANQGEYDKSIADFNEAIRLNPDFAGSYINRGRSYKCKGD